MQVPTIVFAVMVAISMNLVQCDGSGNGALFNIQMPEIPNFKNHFTPIQNRQQISSSNNCMLWPFSNPLGAEISLCGRSSSFLTDGCLKVNRLPHGYSMMICAGSQNLTPPVDCIKPMNLPMGFSAIICSKTI